MIVLLDTLDALGPAQEVEPEPGVHHLSQTFGQLLPAKRRDRQIRSEWNTFRSMLPALHVNVLDLLDLLFALQVVLEELTDAVVHR